MTEVALRSLSPFAEAPRGVQLEAGVLEVGKDILLAYRLSDSSGVVEDAGEPSAKAAWTRADGLWQTTCLEAFWGCPGESAYWEFNLSPARRQWNLYHFDDYRAPVPPRRSSTYDLVEVTQVSGVTYARLRGPMVAAIMEFSLAAVVRTGTGTYYYALKHAAAQPDFHQRASFIWSR